MNNKVHTMMITIFFILFISLMVSQVTAQDTAPTITLFTDKDSYLLGEQITITGTIDQQHATIILITLEHDDFTRFSKVSVENNSFEYIYEISYGDPEGTWNISACITDEDETFSTSTQITVDLPEDILRYHLTWFSPAPDAFYPRGSQMNFSVFVTEDQVGVTNASVRCILPSMDEITLSEIKQGYYQQTYTIPWNSTLGPWMVSSDCQKTVDDHNFSGGNQISFSITPARLTISFLDPFKEQYTLGTQLPVTIRVLYPDKTPVDEALVTLDISDKSIALVSLGDGIYQLNQQIPLSQVGSKAIKITATDPFENQGTIQQMITIVPESRSNITMIVLLGIIGLIGGICVLIIISKKQLIHRIARDTDMEIQEITRLKKEAAEKYYINGLISRKVYDGLQKEYTQRLEELKYRGPLKKTMANKIIYYFKRKKDDQ